MGFIIKFLWWTGYLILLSPVTLLCLIAFVDAVGGGLK